MFGRHFIFVCCISAPLVAAGCGGKAETPVTADSETITPAQTQQRDGEPLVGSQVQYRGTWLFTQSIMKKSKEGDFEALAVFEGTAGFYFGFDLNELPEKFSKTSFSDFKGVSGTFKGMKTVMVMTGTFAQIEVQVLGSPEPIFH